MNVGQTLALVAPTYAGVPLTPGRYPKTVFAPCNRKDIMYSPRPRFVREVWRLFALLDVSGRNTGLTQAIV
jgi:hypothetical protein